MLGSDAFIEGGTRITIEYLEDEGKDRYTTDVFKGKSTTTFVGTKRKVLKEAGDFIKHLKGERLKED